MEVRSADTPFWVTDLCFIIKVWLVTLTDENALTSNRQLVASLSLPVSRSYMPIVWTEMAANSVNPDGKLNLSEWHFCMSKNFPMTFKAKNVIRLFEVWTGWVYSRGCVFTTIIISSGIIISRSLHAWLFNPIWSVYYCKKVLATLIIFWLPQLHSLCGRDTQVQRMLTIWIKCSWGASLFC